MAALTPEEEQFLRDNILCVVSTTKRDGSSQSTPVYYVFENGKALHLCDKTAGQDQERPPRSSGLCRGASS